MDMRAMQQLERRVARIEAMLRRDTAGIDPMENLVGLIGAWDNGLDRDAHRLLDRSGNGMHLGFSGAAVLDGLPDHSFPPYVEFSGGCLLRANENKINIAGNEGTIATGSRGLTFAAWVRFTNSASANEVIAGKWTASTNQRTWVFFRTSTGKLQLIVSSSGTASTASAVGSTTLASGIWYHVVGVYSPSTYVRVFVNGVMDGESTTTVPATLYTGNAPLEVSGAAAGTLDLLAGRVSRMKLAASAAPADMIAASHGATHAMYGV